MAGRKRTPDGKRTRELLRQLPPGFSIEKRSGGHPSVLRPDGEPLRDERGLPVKVTGTYGRQGIERDLARIRRAIERGAD